MRTDQEQMNFLETPEAQKPQNEGMSEADFFGEEKQELDQAGFKLADELAQEIKKQRDIIEVVEGRLGEENAKLRSLQAKMIALLEHHGKKNYTVKGVGTLGITERLSVKIPRTPEEVEAVKQYLTERGVTLDLIFKPNSASINSFYKEELEIARKEGRHVGFKIPGIGEPTYTQSLSLTKKGQ